LPKLFCLRTWLYAAYLVVSSAALLVLLELGLWGLDSITGGTFPVLVRSDYPSNPDDYIKIAIFGESAAQAYGAEKGFEAVLGYDLPKCYPNRKFYIRNYAHAGFTFHGHQAEIAKANMPRYDILLIYAGHNEHHVYLDRIGYFRKPEFKHFRTVRTTPGDDLSLLGRILDYHSRIYALIVRYKQEKLDAAIEKAGGSEARQLFPEFAGEGVLPPGERQKIDGRFRQDLEELARLAEKYGKQVIIMSVPSNESWKPMFSVLSKALPEDKLKAWRHEYFEGLSLYREGKYAQALAHCQNALAIDRGVAILNYLTGMTYRALGNAGESKRFLRLAIDTDGLPIRAPGSLFTIAKSVADNSLNVHYCDMNAIFEKLVDRGSGWEELFVDIQHPTLAGHVVIALGFLGKIAELEPLKNPGDLISQVDFDTVSLGDLLWLYRKQLAISPTDDQTAAEQRISWFYGTSNMSAYPEEFFEQAERELALYHKKYEGSSEAEAYYARVVAMFQAKKDWRVEAHNNMANTLANAGKTDEAIEHYQQALRLKPDYAESYNNLGVLLARAGKIPQAIEDYQKALSLKPDYAKAHNNLGLALAAAGRSDQAIEHLQQAVRLEPDYAEAHNNLGVALTQAGKTEEGIEHFRRVLRLQPESAKAHYNLGSALARLGRTDEAVQSYNRFLQLAPDHVEALDRLAWLLATREPAQSGDPARAVQLAERARQLAPQHSAECLDTLAAAYAAAGRLADAVTTAERAVQLAESAGQAALVKNIQSRLQLYRAGQPYREAPSAPAQTNP
jgi:tetratricopeptide (TPR) repeat protein